MARIDTLPHFLADVAGAIRTAEGSSGSIGASAFDTRIKALKLSTQTNTATPATAASILSGKVAWANGSRITGTMTDRGAVSQTISPGGSYTIPAGYHNGSGKVTASVGYALSGTWKLTASTVYQKKQPSTLTASTARCSLQYGLDGVYEGTGLTINSTSILIGSTSVFSYYDYTTNGKGWRGISASSYPDAYLTFESPCVVTEAFYNYFITIATQSGGGGGSSGNIPVGTISIGGMSHSYGSGTQYFYYTAYENGSVTSKTYTKQASASATLSNVVVGSVITYDGYCNIDFSCSGGAGFVADIRNTGSQMVKVYKLTSASGTLSPYTDCCFDGDSKVLMANGDVKALSAIEIGDTVMTYNEATNEFESNEVTALGTAILPVITKITLEDDTTIKMNEYHPMWTENGWKSIIEYKGLPKLTTEDKLMNNNGEYIAIKSIEKIDLNEERETYYTIKVANDNNFYVNGYLAQGKDKD